MTSSGAKLPRMAIIFRFDRPFRSLLKAGLQAAFSPAGGSSSESLGIRRPKHTTHFIFKDPIETRPLTQAVPPYVTELCPLTWATGHIRESYSAYPFNYNSLKKTRRNSCPRLSRPCPKVR